MEEYINCDCGKYVLKNNLKKHINSQRHMKSLEIKDTSLIKCTRCKSYKDITEYTVKNDTHSKMCSKCQDYMKKYMCSYNIKLAPSADTEKSIKYLNKEIDRLTSILNILTDDVAK